MFTRVEVGETFVNLRPTPARHSFERFPATAEYGALVAEYQASVG